MTLFTDATFAPGLGRMLRPPRPAAPVSDRVPQAELLALIDAGAKVRIEQNLDAARKAAAASLEQDILEEFPDISEWVCADIRERTRERPLPAEAICARFSRFATWAAERGYPKLPYEPSVVAMYLLLSVGQGMSKGEAKMVRTAIAQVHETAGHSAPCQDPLVRAAMRKIDSLPDGDGGKPMPEPGPEQRAA